MLSSHVPETTRLEFAKRIASAALSAPPRAQRGALRLLMRLFDRCSECRKLLDPLSPERVVALDAFQEHYVPALRACAALALAPPPRDATAELAPAEAFSYAALYAALAEQPPAKADARRKRDRTGAALDSSEDAVSKAARLNKPLFLAKADKAAPDLSPLDALFTLER